MSTNNIIFDIKCVTMGLPPLSMGVSSAYKMIKKMPRLEKRKILRKIRKVAKIEIERICMRERSAPRADWRRKSLRQSANLEDQKKSHDPRYILNRIRLVKHHIEHLTREH